MKKHVPNTLTLCNLFLGCCALTFIFHNRQDVAAWCTLGCFLCDYLDGMLARAFRLHSPLGKELDSLADVVSFGVVPGAMLYHMLAASSLEAIGESAVVLAALPAFVLSAFSGLRLAKFNVDTRQTNYFLGLSTPACTVFVLGIAMVHHYDEFGLRDLLSRPVLLYPLIALLSWLLISEIPMFGMKIKSYDLKSNALLLVFVAIFAFLVLFIKHLALSVIIVCYIVASLAMPHQFKQV